MPPPVRRALKRLTKILLISVASLVVVLLVAVWIVNRWLQSPEMHARVEREISLALKIPVKFKKLNLSVFGGIKAEGVTVPDRGRTFLEAPSLIAKHHFFSLLRGKFQLKEIRVESPKILLVQRPNGDWKMPDLPPDLQAVIDAKKKARPASTTPKEPPASPAPKKTAEVLVERVVIKNATAELFDSDNKPFLSGMGISTTMANVSDERVEGRMKVERLIWNGNFGGNTIEALVSYTPQRFLVENLTGSMGGGSIKGGYFNRPGQPSTIKVALENVDIARAATEADAQPPNLVGLITTGTFDAKGLEVKKTAMGNFQFTLRDGSCREIEWINQIGEIARQQDMDLTTFGIKELTANVDILGDRLAIKTLFASAPPLGLSAEGVSKQDGTKLNLQAKFLAEQTFLARRPNIAPQFGPPDERGWCAVDFPITGSLDKPKHNLLEKLTGTKDRTEQRILLGLDVLSGLKGPEPEAPGNAAPKGKKQP